MLHLVLGPLDLDLLGLVVHLDKVVLDITAVPGAGALLGNLLCAVVGLLDGTGIGGLAASSPTCSTPSSASCRRNPNDGSPRATQRRPRPDRRGACVRAAVRVSAGRST